MARTTTRKQSKRAKRSNKPANKHGGSKQRNRGPKEIPLDKEKIFEKWAKEHNAAALSEYYFGYELSPTQADIVRTIAWSESKRTVISCMTRYGKTRSVAIAILLYILMNKNKRILLLAPSQSQTTILRNYVAEMITRSSKFSSLLTHATGASLQSEVSKTRITFINGCELITLTAEGKAERLMGWGGDLIVMDESCLINHEVYRSKISRMLGDNPESILVEISNPWHVNNQFYEHWTSPEFTKIHVGYETALQEGRIDLQFLEEQRENLTPIEFQVLYESDFPDESDDGIFNYGRIKEALIPKKVKGEIILGCDVADKGTDRTVIMTARTDGLTYNIEDIYSEAKSENTDISGRLVKMQEEKIAMSINVDSIGIGVGVVSMLKENVKNRHCEIISCHFGQKARDTKRFANKKAEMYFRLKDLFDQGMIHIPEHKQLIKELLSMRWVHTSAGKIKIIDPDRSPDFADALVYTTWRQNRGTYAIG